MGNPMAHFLYSWMNSMSQEDTTAWMQEVEHCMEQMPRTSGATTSMDELLSADACIMLKTSYLRIGLLSILSLLFSVSLVSAESLREFQERQCKQGKQESCVRAAHMLEGEQHAERIVELGDEFATNVDRSKREADKKPILAEAYNDVLDDYFKAEAENGIKLAVTTDVINLCAEHYHDYWVNRKMWWPTNDVGKPDWSTIYYYIVEHYYGYCLRNAL